MEVQLHAFLTSEFFEGELAGARHERFVSVQYPPVAIGWEAGWAPESVWVLDSMHVSGVKYRSISPAVQPVACRVITGPFRFLKVKQTLNSGHLDT
jgi:hypothetical protein